MAADSENVSLKFKDSFAVILPVNWLMETRGIDVFEQAFNLEIDERTKLF